MTQWVVFKYYFYCKKDPNRHKLEFIVSKNNKTVSERTLKKESVKIMKQLSTDFSEKSDVPIYDFGTLSWPELLDDIRKLIIVNYPNRKGYKIDLWLDRDDEISFWDSHN